MIRVVAERKLCVRVLRNDDANCLVIIFKGSPGSFAEVGDIVKQLSIITDAIGEKRNLIIDFSQMDVSSQYLRYFFENLRFLIEHSSLCWCTVSDSPSEDYICKTFFYIMKKESKVFRSIVQAQDWLRLNATTREG